MTDGTQNFAMVHVPTLAERFWWRLGFCYHLGDEPADIDGDALPGWMMTETHFSFSVADRLRLLLTGRLRVRTTSSIDTPSPTIVKNRLDWQVFAPGETS